MKKIQIPRTFILNALILLCCSLTTSISIAKNVNSTFGFSMQVEDDWMFFSEKEVSDPVAITQKLKAYGFSQAGIDDIIQRVSSGSSEMLYIPTEGNQFSENDNINMIKSYGFLPEKETFPELCKATEQQISQAFRKETKMDKCEYRQHGKFTSVYLEFNGLIEGTRNAQYHLHGESDLYLVFSLTSTNVYFKKSNLALDVMLNSIVIQSLD